MTQEKVREVVQLMIDNNEDPKDIEKFVKQAKALIDSQAEAKEAETQVDATVTENDTASNLEDGSSDLPEEAEVEQPESMASERVQKQKEKEAKKDKPKTAEELFDLTEEGFVNWAESQNIPGLVVEEVGIGDYVDVTIGGKSLGTIGLSGLLSTDRDKQMSAEKIQQILDYKNIVDQKSPSQQTVIKDFETERGDNIIQYSDQQLEKLNTLYGDTGYNIELVSPGRPNAGRERSQGVYKVTRNGEQIFEGRTYDLQTFMAGDISEEDANQVQTRRSALNSRIKEANKDEFNDRLSKVQDKDLVGLDDGSFALELANKINFPNDNIKASFVEYFTRNFNDPKNAQAVLDGNAQDILQDFIDSEVNTVGGKYAKVKQVSDQILGAYNSLIQKDEEGNSNISSLVNSNKIRKSNEINSSVIENVISSGFVADVTVGGQTTSKWFETKEAAEKAGGTNIIEPSKFKRIIAAADTDDIIRLDSQQKEIDAQVEKQNEISDKFIKDYKAKGEKLTSQAKNEGVTNIEYNENTGLYTVTASDQGVQDKYTKLFNNWSGELKSFQKDFGKTNEALTLKQNSIAKHKQDASISESLVSKNYNFADILTAEVNASFNNTFLSVPALFGSEGAINATNEINENLQSQFEAAQQYGDVESVEDALKFGTRTLAQQSAPIVLALTTAGAGSSVGLSANAISSVTAGLFGVSSAGGKKVELEGRLDTAAQAMLDLEELENIKDKIDPEQYAEAKFELERQIAENDMTTNQYWGSIISTGVIEGLVTKYIGTIPNANKAWKAIANPVDDAILAANRTWYQNAAHKLGQFGYRTGGEVIEESAILLGNNAAEAITFGKEFNLEGLDQTIVTSIITGGTMNGPSLAYSGIMQHMANPELRQLFKDNKDQITKLKQTLKDPDLSDVARNSIHSEITALNNFASKLTDDMEVKAILHGPKKLGEITSIGNKINDLKQRAGVDFSLPEDQQQAQIQKYLEGLDSKKRKSFESELKILNERKEKLDKSTDYADAATRMYGAQGKVIAEKLAKTNKNFSKLDTKEQAVLIHQEYKKQETNRMIGNAKSDPSVQAYVESKVYGTSFANAKTKDGKPRKKRNAKAENDLYRQVGATINSRVADGVIVNREENISAKGLLGDKRLEDLNLIQATDTKDLTDKATKAYEDLLEQATQAIEEDGNLSQDQKQSKIEKTTAAIYFERDQIISEINSGETNGAIVGGQYIVTSVPAAQEQIAQGNVLAGTVLSHEISHAMDARAMTESEIAEYGRKLQNWMVDNDQQSHIEAMNRMAQTGIVDQNGNFKPYYDSTKDIKDQSDLFWDEYGKSIQDIYRRPSNRNKRRKLKNTSSSTGRFIQKLQNKKDFVIDTPNKAAMYMSSFLEGFEKGKIGVLQKRKIDYKNSEEGRQELADSTRRSANSPILHAKANAQGKKVNALYENKDSNPDYIFDIAKEYEGMVKKFLDRMEAEGKWDLGQGEERANNIADFIMNATISERGIVGMVMGKGFKENEMVDVKDPKTGETVQEPNTISRYLNGTFPQRLTEFVAGTTIDPGVFKADLENMGELVSTERADKLTDDIVQEANNQFDTPLLEQFNFTQEMLDDFRSAVARTVGVKLPALDAKQGKNQSISPLIRELKKQFGVKNGPIHKIVKQLMGKTKAEVEAFLVDPGNKKAILDAMTTTWLASNLPMAVQKKVRGVGYTTDHVGRKKGTKPGDIEAWNASEDGPYKGMTDGKQKIRRNPNAAQDVTNAQMLSKFAKGETMTQMNRAGLEKLQLAMAQELGLEMFKADLLNEGELSKIFEGRQELFDRVLADNFVEEFVRQTERGITKRSGNVHIARAVHDEIISSYMKNKGDKVAFLEDMKQRGIPQSDYIAFDFDRLDALMNDNMPAGYKNPIKEYVKGKGVSNKVESIVKEAMDMGAFNQKDAKAGDAARVKMSTELGKLVDELPLAVFLSPVTKDSFFGFMSSSRAFDVSKLDEKDYSPEAKKAMLGLKNKIDKKIKEALSKKQDILSPFISQYGFNPENTRLFNAGVGLMGKVEKQILNSNETGDKKLELHQQQFGKEHREANIANPLMLELVNNVFLDLASKDRGAAVGWVYWNSMSTNNTSGPRSLSTWNLTQYEDGPQGLYTGVNVKTGELKFFKTRAEAEKAANIVDVEINKDNPIYKEAEAEAEKKVRSLVDQGVLDQDDAATEMELIMFGGVGKAINMSSKKGVDKPIDWGTGTLRLKGEHVTASATTSAEIVIAGLKALDNGDFNKAKSDIKKLTQEFDQALGAKVFSDIQDEMLGTTSRASYARIYSVLESNPAVYTNINTFKTLDGNTASDLALNMVTKRQVIDSVNELKRLTDQETKDAKTMDKTVQLARTMRSANPRGMSAFDFDETLIDEGQNFITATKDGETKKISSGQWPLQGPKLAADGWSFDFSDFVNVRGGIEGPLFTKFKERLAKFGPENMFILTARPAEAATAIHGWLKSKGVEIPLENITGLGNSTGEAKALWMLRKFEQGYNDMYFVDDALPNVAAVKNVLDQLDIKSDVQIAKRSANANSKQDLNLMLERSKGVDRNQTFNKVQARNKGLANRKRQLFIPPSADDFEGLMYYNMGKGREGEADAKFFKDLFYDPYNRADRELDMYKQTVKEDMKAINKKFPDVRKKLRKDFAKTGYTNEQAMRIYLYDKNENSVPGISEADQKKVAAAVAADYKLMSYANLMEGALKIDGYLKPDASWNVGSFNGDFADASGLKRTEYLKEWNDNIDNTFDDEMLNKLEAVHGRAYRSALEDSIARMKSGTNRPTIRNKQVNNFLDWLNGSVGAIMFFNGRSAVLQTLSTVNFINFEDNNIFAASKALANQKQFWQDFSFLFNSPMLKQRRGGLQSDLNASELARLAEQGGVRAVVGRLLQFGFTPTQVADSFAIASGGSTFYRNRINKYTKQGMDQAAAEAQAFVDFQEIAESTQQSSRPDKISQEQASVLGRLILAFQNTPMQYNRLIKKAALDLINGRGNTKANISRILYYGAIQNIIFSALQNALFAVIDDGEEDEEFLDTKIDRIANGTLDSLLRGSGIYGAILSTAKNTILKYLSEREKGMDADNGKVLVEALNVSPPLGSKARKMYSAMTTDKWNKDIYDKIPLYNIDNPIWDAAGNTVEATTNFPAGRIQRKISNLKAASDNENATWQRLALFFGWDKWSLGIERPEEIEQAREEVREEKRESKKQIRKEQERKKKEKQERKYLKDQQKEKQENKKARCAAATRDGSRCTGVPVDGKYCTIHAKVEQRTDGKQVQCKKTKSDGKRCKMQTSNSSGFCYYHD